jgi:hypothetical protein
VHGVGDKGDFVHELYKLVGIERLCTVGEGFIGLVVHFDDQAIGADRSRGPSQGQNHIALAGAMARIHNDGQMAGPLHCGNDAEVKCIARVIGEGAYSALAQNYLVVAMSSSSRVADIPRLTITGLRVRPARLSKEKFCILRAPI